MADNQKDFEKIVAEAYDRLPDWIKSKIKNVAITVEDFVDNETVIDMGLESYMSLLGLYKGVPQTERTVAAGFELPDTIVLYRMPILEEALESSKPVEDVVFETLWHEIAHHFGLSEEDVAKREGEEFGDTV
jgi:predicted Zn-dependent protease with MMP-like domain